MAQVGAFAVLDKFAVFVNLADARVRFVRMAARFEYVIPGLAPFRDSRGYVPVHADRRFREIPFYGAELFRHGKFDVPLVMFRARFLALFPAESEVPNVDKGFQVFGKLFLGQAGVVYRETPVPGLFVLFVIAYGFLLVWHLFFVFHVLSPSGFFVLIRV
jgi:hypothetical protein